MIAIIPAREKDSILNEKNNLPFGNHTLLTNKIMQLKKVENIEEIIVSTDSTKYIKIAQENNVSFLKRPKKLVNNASNFRDLIHHIVDNVKSENILWAPVVTPFIDSYDYEVSIEKYYDGLNQGYDSLISVVKLKRKVLDSNGPLNFSFHDSEEKQFSLFQYINGISIAPTNKMRKWKYNWGKNPYKFLLNSFKAIEICDKTDYKIACSLLNFNDE